MKRKVKVSYSVTSFGMTMWCRKLKRWLNMSDDRYGQVPHKGYSSHKDCRTKKAAERHCRSLDRIADKGAKIIVLRHTCQKGVRRYNELYFKRTAK